MQRPEMAVAKYPTNSSISLSNSFKIISKQLLDKN